LINIFLHFNKSMKKLLAIVVLSLLLTTPSQADDIRDIQIEGMSIGDSLLDYFDKERIEKEKLYLYEDEGSKEVAVFLYEDSLEAYDRIQVSFEDKDKKYTIVAINGFIDFVNDIERCDEKKDEIVFELSSIFKNIEKLSDSGKHPGDSTGKSTFKRTSFFINKFEKRANLEVACFDFSENYITADKLSVVIMSQEHGDWLTELYK